MTRRQGLRIPFPLETAVLLVELAEDWEGLTPAEAQLVEGARAQLEAIAGRALREPGT